MSSLETRVKVVYLDGSFEIFKARTYQHNKEHRMFYVVVSDNRIMIPDANVRSIGVGHVTPGGFEYD